MAPNNYTYVHSLTYTCDNYTNTGIEVTQAVTKNWILQMGLVSAAIPCRGTWVRRLTNLMPGNALYPGTTFLKDPGAHPLGHVWRTLDQRRRQG